MSVSQNFGSAANVASMANVGFNFVRTGGTVAGDVNVTGNLVVRGTTTQIDTVTETTTAGTLGLAANNTGDVIDIGVYGTYQSASVNKLTGLVRSPGTSNYFLFSGINQTELAGNTIPVADFTGANSATLVANVQAYQISSSGQVTVASLVANSAIAVSSGGTGTNTLPTGQIVLGNGTGAVSALANVSLAAGAYGNANTIAVQTTDVYGRTTAITNTAIAITAAQITSGQLPVSYGGTGASTLPTGQILIGDGTGPISVLANSALAAGAYGNANTIAVTTTDVYGRITGVTNTAISIAPTQINSTTGTGAVVLADNPTLLGTTTAATLNVTALNVTSLNVTYSNVNSITTNSVNVGALTYAASGAFVVFGASANSYQQVVVENSNTGTQASADFIVSNGISTDGAFYGDFGMNGQNFVGTGSLNVANTVYLYSANVDLAIGTSTSNAIHFVVNNGATDSMTINANGAVSLASALGLAYGGTGQTSFTSDGIIYGNGSGALQATVAAGVSDQAYTNQVLTVTNAGVPVWSSAVDGGTF
jgi:hypothetical protein